MQDSIYQVKAFARRFLLAAVLIYAAFLAQTPARAAEAAMTVEIPAGKFKAVRMPNLPKDTLMAVSIQCENKLVVSLLNQQDARHFPRADNPVFAGSLDRKLSFTVTIPQTGTYFLVLDNRQSAEAQQVKFLIRAQTGKTKPSTPSPPPAPLAPEQKRLDRL